MDKIEKGCWRGARRWTKMRKVARQKGLMEVGRGGACVPARVAPQEGASIVSRCASCAIHKHFNAWRCLLCGWGTCPLRMETPPLRLGMCSLRMETPLRGRSGGHTGTAPTISRVAPCPKVASEQFADGQKQEMYAGEVLADGLKREKVAGRGSADGQKRERLRGRRV